MAAAASSALAQTPDCAAPIDHVPDASVAYKPSTDVAPADLPGSSPADGAQDRAVMGLRVDNSKLAPQIKALPVRPEIYAGTVEVKPESGEVTMNGRPLSAPSPCSKP